MTTNRLEVQPLEFVNVVRSFIHSFVCLFVCFHGSTALGLHFTGIHRYRVVVLSRHSSIKGDSVLLQLSLEVGDSLVGCIHILGELTNRLERLLLGGLSGSVGRVQ